MITTVTTTRQGRKSWRTGQAETITETWTQIEGTIAEITEILGEAQRPGEGRLIHHVDAGDQVVTVEITTRPVVTADGTERHELPQVGEQVRILAAAWPEGSPGSRRSVYYAQGFRTTVL